MSKQRITTPQVTIKWRTGEQPYVEIRTGAGELLVAGWVHPSQDEMKPIVMGDNPLIQNMLADIAPEDWGDHV